MFFLFLGGQSKNQTGHFDREDISYRDFFQLKSHIKEGAELPLQDLPGAGVLNRKMMMMMMMMMMMLMIVNVNTDKDKVCRRR